MTNAPFTAGAAARDITPTGDMINNSLHPQMKVQQGEYGSPLQAKTLAMSFGDIHILLVSLDLVVVMTEHCDDLRQAIAAATGLRREDIVISATHSHSTPFSEPLTGPHPFFDFVKHRVVEASIDACRSRQPARFGHGVAHVVGASFNTQVFRQNGGMKFTRDFREGLASGRPIDPRLNVVRIDDANGKPIAGWIRFAAHPACVIFNAPISGEYPGYMAACLSEVLTGGAPVLFGLGTCGDVNCVPMFGQESDSKNLGLNLAGVAGRAFEAIRTRPVRRLLTATRSIPLPLDPAPTVAHLDREIAELQAFVDGLDKDPTLEWVLGFNCKKDWPVESKKGSIQPLLEWTLRMREAVQTGRRFPSHWASEITTWILDDLGLAFYPGEPFVELGLALSARSPLVETLFMGMTNGSHGYIGPDESRRRGGYEMYTSPRYAKLEPGRRPLPYALGAGECLLEGVLGSIGEALKSRV